jgi:hypothetical protein
MLHARPETGRLTEAVLDESLPRNQILRSFSKPAQRRRMGLTMRRVDRRVWGKLIRYGLAP